jgi:hypothetical protein
MSKVVSGEDKAWEFISKADPVEVCRNTEAFFDSKGNIYRLKSFGRFFTVNPEKKEILSSTPEGEVFLKRHAHFFRLSLLWYLVKARNVKPTGKLVNPNSIPGGDLFFKGSHILPLEDIAKKYAKDREGFIHRGKTMGGRKVKYGDEALEIYPLPRIPVTLILWLEDEEFPPRADLLFDSTGISHLPLDILWSVAMMSVLVFL